MPSKGPGLLRPKSREDHDPSTRHGFFQDQNDGSWQSKRCNYFLHTEDATDQMARRLPFLRDRKEEQVTQQASTQQLLGLRLLFSRSPGQLEVWAWVRAH